MTMQQAKCEHCGSWVAPANTCPKCGKDHSVEWIEKANKDGAFADTWFAFPFLIWTIYTFVKDVNFSTWWKVGLCWFVVVAVIKAIDDIKEKKKVD